MQDYKAGCPIHRIEMKLASVKERTKMRLQLTTPYAPYMSVPPSLAPLCYLHVSAPFTVHLVSLIHLYNLQHLLCGVSTSHKSLYITCISIPPPLFISPLMSLISGPFLLALYVTYMTVSHFDYMSHMSNVLVWCLIQGLLGCSLMFDPEIVGL